MKKYTVIKENFSKEFWEFVVIAQIEGFVNPITLKGSLEVDKNTPEGDVGEMIDKKMDSLVDLLNYEIISIDKK